MKTNQDFKNIVSIKNNIELKKQIKDKINKSLGQVLTDYRIKK